MAVALLDNFWRTEKTFTERWGTGSMEFEGCLQPRGCGRAYILLSVVYLGPWNIHQRVKDSQEYINSHAGNEHRLLGDFELDLSKAAKYSCPIQQHLCLSPTRCWYLSSNGR